MRSEKRLQLLLVMFFLPSHQMSSYQFELHFEVNKVQSQITEKKKASKGADKCAQLR